MKEFYLIERLEVSFTQDERPEIWRRQIVEALEDGDILVAVCEAETWQQARRTLAPDGLTDRQKELANVR